METMHVTSGHSPEQANGATSTSQQKLASDSGTSFSSQFEGNKRERGDHDADPVKRECSSGTENADLLHGTTESNLKYEIARITEKGGVVDLEGVERLVQLMQQDRMERKLDWDSHSVLLNVMASTDKVDCLNQFVQLGGLPVLDEWLQDIQKVKVGDANSPEDGDKSVEEFLLVLLRALEKLPVNLCALQMCNIGRSVNHLRSHKNIGIQRKARTIVDAWKKRVGAEMMSNDAKSSSTQAAAPWPSKSRLPEASHGGSRTPSGSDVAMKTSIPTAFHSNTHLCHMFSQEQQEEVDQLLHSTRIEIMHLTSGHSPMQANGATSTLQQKPASDGGQNSGTSISSQIKGNKRERGDHSADPVKRERSSRTENADLLHGRTECNLKYEIARMTEKCGVVDLEGVERLVQLMQQDRMERKMDLVSRSILVNVMASTDKIDCLNLFVQLRGLPVLDEWLQDIQKVRVGNANSPKDGDKYVEEFLLVLLRALDKLPINLHALQMCNIGRSVNHLRSHENIEIQRKARTIVDAWKKRVVAEMISNDAKSSSTQAVAAWPSKSTL